MAGGGGGGGVLLSHVKSILVPLNDAQYFTNLTWMNYSIVKNVVCKWSKKNLCMCCKSTWTQTLLEDFIFKIKFSMRFANHFVKVNDFY